MFVTKFVVALLALAVGADAEVWTGEIKDIAKGHQFVGKFVFNNHIGEVGGLTGFVNSTGDTTKLFMLLFSDENDANTISWPNYNDSLTCEEAKQVSKSKCSDDPKDKNYQPRPHGDECYYKIMTNPVTKSGELFSVPITQIYRQRYWFFVIADCSPGGIQDLTYDLHVINYNFSAWDQEFGMNEHGLNTFFVAFSLIVGGLVLVEAYSAWQLKIKLSYLHPIVRIFLVVLILQLIMVCMNAAHYGSFSSDGVGMPSVKDVGEVFDALARCGFIMLLMLLAKGWTIKNEELTDKKFILGVPVAVLFIDLFYVLINKKFLQSPESVDIGVGGYVLLTMMTCVWFAFAVWFSVVICGSAKTEDNPIKRKLFTNLAVVYIPWFLGLPLVTVLTLVVDPWARYKIVTTVSLAVSTAAYGAMTAFLWHSWAEDNFNVNQPDIMGGSIDTYDSL